MWTQSVKQTKCFLTVSYCDQNTPRISELFNDADDVLFQSVLHRPNHALQYLLQDCEPTQYSMRSRSHTKELIRKTPNLNNSHFLIRLLYKDCYWSLQQLFLHNNYLHY